MMTDFALEAHGLVKRFGGRAVLNGVDLAVPASGVTVILGANGAGKTTLLRAAMGMAPLDGGSLRVAGLDVQGDPTAVRRRIGFVPDRPDVPPWMTTADLFRFLAPHYPTWSYGDAARIADDLRVPELTSFGAMSRGESTRALLAAAMAPQPRVLLMDEPFGGLDPLAREEVIRGVIAVLRSERRAVIVTTHELDVAVRIADHIAIMNAGRVERFGTLDEIIGSFTGEERASSPVAALRDAFAEVSGVSS